MLVNFTPDKCVHSAILKHLPSDITQFFAGRCPMSSVNIQDPIIKVIFNGIFIFLRPSGNFLKNGSEWFSKENISNIIDKSLTSCILR